MRLRIGEWLLNRRWWVVASTSLSIFIFEGLEYRPFLEGISINFLEEILFYGVALPLSVGLALSWAASSRSELTWLNYYQNLTNNLIMQLHNAHSRRELASALLGFFQVTMPLIGATIYAYDERSQKYRTILNWWLKDNAHTASSISECTAEGCACLHFSTESDPMVLQPCRDSKAAASPDLHCFCIPFLYSNMPVGAVRLYFPASHAPSTEQNRLLKEVAPKIAAEFQRVQLELMIKRRKYSLSDEQQRIARDVHDTLGHSLAYLRLRLDHVSMEFDQAGVEKVRQEVEALRDVAKEAYEQMRVVLTELNAESESGIDEALINYADKISQRADFELDVKRYGEQRSLPPLIQRNILYIFREILTNIEKHAHAKQVDVILRWQDTHLEIDVNDDGIGFDSSKMVGNGHFGMKNMQDRAYEIQAQLSISSGPAGGSCHTLIVPYELIYEVNRR